MTRKNINERIGFFILRLATFIVLIILGIILYDIFSQGLGVISWEFLTQPPRRGMTEGGIWPAIAGTIYVSLITIIFSVPLGMFAAIYLSEYARKGRLNRVIRIAIRNLSGVPSIVYGLFGVVIFVEMLNLGTSLISASLTLAILTLPWTITASEEALKAVPQAYREGSLALGATRWEAIRTNVIPGIA